jgi:excinuclease ABC subunit C
VKRKALLKRFGSVKGVAAASVEELSGTQGISAELAQLILRELN